MARPRVAYACTECGARQGRWVGRCPDCGAWNSLEEVVVEAAAPPAARRAVGYAGEAAQVRALAEVRPAREAQRLATGLGELDRVLGGGLVPGSVVLLGGDPGVGKSTLLLQALAHLGREAPVLYVTGEESLRQVALRAQRLGLGEAPLRLLAETQVEAILEHAAREAPRVMVVDSMQTVHTEALGSAPGSVGQVRESAARLVRHAKATGTALFLVGHVTKEGTLAGPRVLEHMVDTVLYFEGDTGSRFRVVRAVKNRFGAVNELGVFAMTDAGLREVSNPSALFLQRHERQVPGSVILVTREGTRPLLVEVQALVAEAHGGHSRRVAVGLDVQRLGMLLAVLRRHAGVSLHDQDVFLNVVGGVRVGETAADLAVLLAVLSSLRDRPLPRELAVFGEVGLAGEIRPVQGGPERLREAAKHGFRRAVVPRANAPRGRGEAGLAVRAVRRLEEALVAAFEEA